MHTAHTTPQAARNHAHALSSSSSSMLLTANSSVSKRLTPFQSFSVYWLRSTDEGEVHYEDQVRPT